MSDRHHLVQILLPVYDNEGSTFGAEPFAQVRAELTEVFGGVTAYIQAPARGLWKEEDGEVRRDDLIVYEVMTAELNRSWWSSYRQELERRFRQEVIVMRTFPIEPL